MRRTRFVATLAVAALATVGVLFAVALTPSNGASHPWIGVRGNKLVDRGGDTIRLLGVNRPGTEYQCVDGEGFFEGPSDAASIRAMKGWRINAVRVPLNESCWLGGHERIEPELQGASYRNAIREYVNRLEAAGLYVILEMQWAAPGDHRATGIIPQPDADHAPDFWRSVATEYRDDRAVVFDLYNEPHDVDWNCWQWGCDVNDKWFGPYRATGMTQLVEAVRSTGAEQPIMIGGLNWGEDLSGWLEHLPPDPAKALVASTHSYDFNPCSRECRGILVNIARRHPVVAGEIGEGDCDHDYIDPYMRWADRHGISYLGWAWYTADDLSCYDGPKLIEDYAGTPTPFGVGLRDHLRLLYSSKRR